MTELHCMVDIETCSTQSNAIILSIGAVPFSIDGVDGFDYFYDGADWHLFDTRFHMDYDTMDWWDKQDAVVKEEAFSFKTKPEELLSSFLNWVEFDHKFSEIWCKGASFDFPILNHALRAYGMDELPYGKLRCARTLYKLADVDSKDYVVNGAHNALNDAVGQAHAAVVAITKLKGWKDEQ